MTASRTISGHGPRSRSDRGSDFDPRGGLDGSVRAIRRLRVERSKPTSRSCQRMSPPGSITTRRAMEGPISLHASGSVTNPVLANVTSFRLPILFAPVFQSVLDARYTDQHYSTAILSLVNAVVLSPSPGFGNHFRAWCVLVPFVLRRRQPPAFSGLAPPAIAPNR